MTKSNSKKNDRVNLSKNDYFRFRVSAALRLILAGKWVLLRLIVRLGVLGKTFNVPRNNCFVMKLRKVY